MSLITDTDYLIHRLRLSYLRDVDDPYGARVISLDPSYHNNPYIVASGLADADRWPEIAAPPSPPLSEDETDRPSGFPGAKLKYTRTIMGNKSGAMGYRVHGKRQSESKRMSGTPKQEDVQNFMAAGAPVQDVLNNAAPISSNLNQQGANGNWAPTAVLPKPVDGAEPTPPEPAPPAPKVVQFIPKFKGAAEMEARRKARMVARRQAPGAAKPPPLAIDSSDEDDPPPPVEESLDDSDVDSDFGVPANIDEEDEFDPDFAASRTPGINSDSPSDVNSILSSSIPSTSNSSVPISPPAPQPSRKADANLTVPSIRPPRLRSKASANLGSSNTHYTKAGDSDRYYPPRKLDTGGRMRDSSQTTETTAPPSQDVFFARRPVAPIKPLKSALTAMLASTAGSTNPFAELYAAISGRAETASITLQVYFPHSQQPDKPMQLVVRKDASVEEVIGFALWSYWEDGWLPKLDEGLSGEDDPKWRIRLSAIGWIMRLAEEDGEVDDDFPPPDRNGKILKFKDADAFAILEASHAQTQQNEILEGKIQRRPSRTTAAARKVSDKPPPASLAVPTPSGSNPIFGSSFSSAPLSTSLGPSSYGPQIFLRIRVADTADAVHISTTINVSAGMYMQEALELVCRKRKLANPNDYVLLVADKSLVIALDRTVASLAGTRELVLMKKSALTELGGVMEPGRTTDPNASIFKRMSDVPESQYPATSEYDLAYKKYTIYRKMPMLVTRQERTLAIDGVYLHIMPSANKAKNVFDSGRTLSYHIKSIADCQQSTKSSSIFRLVVNRSSGKKQYDYEAESPKYANEIVQKVRALKSTVERSGTVNRSRRSRHVI
ncbi:SIN1-domain-containing protein [Pleurotus eryngii]|uniref:SIN1-domain-containing protein n=1 Tax=Pleurotus eryngii TaxID=5323 RepID=A0A9P5ZT31_PLEER|nr:SIN1-domain-containing protein [Pleurotus eryngii]